MKDFIGDFERDQINKINNDRLKQAEEQLYKDILSTPIQDNSAEAATIGEYLSLLLSTLWLQGDGFSGKRPFGDSGWDYEIYTALGQAGLVDCLVDEDGFIDEFTTDEQYKADELILQVIKYMGKP